MITLLLQIVRSDVLTLRGTPLKLDATPAMFGVIDYASQGIQGKIVMPESKGDNFCSQGDYEIDSKMNRGEGPVLLLGRGECSFAEKTWIAQKKGAKAVIIYDSNGESNYEDIIMSEPDLVTMASSINIASYFLSYDEGRKLIESLSQSDTVNISAVFQKRSTVALDVYLSPSEGDMMEFLGSLGPLLAELEQVDLDFRFVTFTDGSRDECATNLPLPVKTCFHQPDWSRELAGWQMLGESMRQSCMWKASQRRDLDKQFLSYLSYFATDCLRSRSSEQLSGCSMSVSKKVGFAIQDFRRPFCDYSEALQLFVEDRYRGYSHIDINGKRYAGRLEAEALKQALCMASEVPGPACKAKNRVGKVGIFVTIVATLASVLGVAAFFVYRRRKNTRQRKGKFIAGEESTGSSFATLSKHRESADQPNWN